MGLLRYVSWCSPDGVDKKRAIEAERYSYARFWPLRHVGEFAKNILCLSKGKPQLRMANRQTDYKTYRGEEQESS